MQFFLQPLYFPLFFLQIFLRNFQHTGQPFFLFHSRNSGYLFHLYSHAPFFYEF